MKYTRETADALRDLLVAVTDIARSESHYAHAGKLAEHITRLFPDYVAEQNARRQIENGFDWI